MSRACSGSCPDPPRTPGNEVERYGCVCILTLRLVASRCCFAGIAGTSRPGGPVGGDYPSRPGEIRVPARKVARDLGKRLRGAPGAETMGAAFPGSPARLKTLRCGTEARLHGARTAGPAGAGEIGKSNRVRLFGAEIVWRFRLGAVRPL